MKSRIFSPTLRSMGLIGGVALLFQCAQAKLQMPEGLDDLYESGPQMQTVSDIEDLSTHLLAGTVVGGHHIIADEDHLRGLFGMTDLPAQSSLLTDIDISPEQVLNNGILVQQWQEQIIFQKMSGDNLVLR